ncbi:squalene synthase [Cristinia sonorae]|uniref:Squalene synthase n=1 Tax=Cristinia sonorae TaxID=1940300 RepID=A0A8K0UVA0_9AGAR|nr:squalene synthase [Cristinia sonorae]
MGALSWLALLITHPNEFRILLQYWLWNDTRDVSAKDEWETTGYDRETMKKCWHFLDLTSRSFSGVVKQLEGDMARVICLYYLVLRGLDTIEDDMTIPDEKKQKLLRQFHQLTLQKGWTFTENGPNEADRQLLVEYDNVIEELHLLPPTSLDIIIDITKKMQTGMADYAHKAQTTGSVYVEKIEEYDLYCHYVAGLVGEGLSGLFSASGKEGAFLAKQLELSNSMGLFLQKTNIIRDFREDVDEKRYFWPREIWGSERFGKACGGRPGFKEMCEMHQPGNEKQAQWVQSAMIVNVLNHATDSLDYLKLLKNQSIFNFCAIPQTMAIATMSLCFMNPEMFQRNIKIRKAEAADLILKSKNPRDVGHIFRKYARSIHARADPADPSFIAISVACGKIEQWCEHHYPSFVEMIQGQSGTKQSFNSADARSTVAIEVVEREQNNAFEKRKAEYAKKYETKFAPLIKAVEGKLTPEEQAELTKKRRAQQKSDKREVIMFAVMFIVIVVFMAVGISYVIMRMTNHMEQSNEATRVLKS